MSDAESRIADRIADEISKLPPVPATVLDLRHVMADRNVDFERVLPLLERDPGLSADLLKFANSARFGVGHRVDTLDEALVYFGMSNLMNLVNSMFADAVVLKAFSALKGIDGYVAHSRDISRACGILADSASMNKHDRQTVSLVGLLHDIGRLVLTIASNQKALPAMGTSSDQFQKIVDEEQGLWGIDHCNVGSMVCRKWNFPEVFVEAIRLHHSRPDEKSGSVEAMVVFLAHVITVKNMPLRALEALLPDGLRSRLNLTAEALVQAGLVFFEQSETFEE